MSVFLGNLALVSGTKYKIGRMFYNPPKDYQPTDGQGVTVDSLPEPTPPDGMVVANTYVDTATKAVTYDYIPSGGNDRQTYDPNNLASVQAYKISQINTECSSCIDTGYYSYAEGVKNTDGTAKALLYKSDLKHQIDMLGELSYAQQGQETTWKDASIIGECHVVTAAVINQLYNEMRDHIKWCKTNSDKLCGTVMAATTVDAVNAIAWPEEPAPTAPTTTTGATS